MNDQTDAQLLLAYAEHRSERAFTELVRRHVDLVHSAAVRMVCDAHLAQDVTQGVFLALARNAAQLTDRPVLSGWLHRTAQNIAAQTVRTDVRRRIREQEVAAMNELLSAEPDALWEHIAPQLDTALGELSEADRDALLLRYFQRKSASEMATTLGISDEAAQKRVNRAVERLREFFSKRGLTVDASGLVVVISTNAVQAAPAGLAVTISAAAALAGTAVSSSTVIAATKAMAMTTIQKLLISATLAVVVGAGIYEAHQASKLRSQVQNLQKQQAPLAEQILQLQRERDEAVNRLVALADERERAKGNSSELLKLRGEVTRLRKEAETTAAFAKEAMDFQSDMMQALSNTAPVRTFAGTIMTAATWDQAIVTGGWRTPSGKRAIVLVSFHPGDDSAQLTIDSKIVEYTEEAGQKLGLSQFNFEERKTDGTNARAQAHTLTLEQSEAILKAAKDSEGTEITADHSVSTVSGRQAEVQTVEIHQTPSGEKYPTGPVLNFIPTISPDGKSVQMIITAQLNYLIQPPRN